MIHRALAILGSSAVVVAAATSAQAGCATECGDCNGDGVVTLADAVYMDDVIGGVVNPPRYPISSCCDIDEDGRITIIDADLIRDIVGGKAPELECPEVPLDPVSGAVQACIEGSSDGMPWVFEVEEVVFTSLRTVLASSPGIASGLGPAALADEWILRIDETPQAASNAKFDGETGTQPECFYSRVVHPGSLIAHNHMEAPNHNSNTIRVLDPPPTCEMPPAVICAVHQAALHGDSDGDTVDDPTDNCVDVANTDQADANGDGIGDRCDNCDLFLESVRARRYCSDDLTITGCISDFNCGDAGQCLERFEWSVPVAFTYATETFVEPADIATYTTTTANGSGSTLALDSSPAPGSGRWWLFRGRDCPGDGTWQTNPGAEPERDAAIP